MWPTDPKHRRCPVTGRWAIIAPERAARPIELGGSNPNARGQDPGGFCPFCPGCERESPGEVYAVRATSTAPDTPGWSLRVVPNRYPAVRANVPDGYGYHEILIDTPRHETDPAGLSIAETAAGFVAIRERAKHLSGKPGIKHVSAYRNVGAEAGASLAHSHGQILATPFVPADVAAEWTFADRADGCPTCKLIDGGERIVATAPGFVAVCPPAGRFDFELWVIPTRHADLGGRTNDELLALAGLMRRLRRAIDRALGRPAYNEVIRSGLGRHGRLEIYPRTARAAGFELGTGCHILTLPPEQAAEVLREAVAAEDKR